MHMTYFRDFVPATPQFTKQFMKEDVPKSYDPP